jgi:hypothetical protein
MILFKKVVDDIVKSLQILPKESVLFKIYENAIGKENMKVLSSFSDLYMYNFGVMIRRDMDDKDRAYLEQNIQIALSQKEIDIEDAIAIRQLKDVDQAERLLVVRRKKRIKQQMEQAQQQAQMQMQSNAQAAQVATQAEMEKLKMEAELELQKMQAKAQIDAQLLQIEYQFRTQIENIKAQATLGFRTEEQEFKEKLEVMKENRKDERQDKETSDQSKLISQRQGKRGEVAQEGNIVNNLLNQ